MQHEFSTPAMGGSSLPGIWMAPQGAVARRGEYDRFRLCPLGASDGPPIRPKPPLLKECGNVLVNSDFEPGGNLAPWVVGTEPDAVQASADYSCDRDGQPGGTESLWQPSVIANPVGLEDRVRLSMGDRPSGQVKTVVF